MDMSQIVGLVLGYGSGVVAIVVIIRQMRAVEAAEPENLAPGTARATKRPEAA